MAKLEDALVLETNFIKSKGSSPFFSKIYLLGHSQIGKAFVFGTNIKGSNPFVLFNFLVLVAQMVEQWIENPRVGGSSPP